MSARGHIPNTSGEETRRALHALLTPFLGGHSLQSISQRGTGWGLAGYQSSYKLYGHVLLSRQNHSQKAKTGQISLLALYNLRRKTETLE